MYKCSCPSTEQLLIRVKQNEKAISQLILMISHLNRQIERIESYHDS